MYSHSDKIRVHIIATSVQLVYCKAVVELTRPTLWLLLQWPLISTCLLMFLFDVYSNDKSCTADEGFLAHCTHECGRIFSCYYND